MTLLNTLIIGWSVVWGLFLIALSHANHRGAGLLFIAGLTDYVRAGPFSVLICAPLFAFSFWAIGCAIIYAVAHFINKIEP